ncbi:MAG: hypothetical protein IJS07_08325 [Bacteroidales bacterium]|nr:hypothetical protein [Bacteroidales bacterium]
MKKIYVILAIAAMTIFAASCGNKKASNNAPAEPAAKEAAAPAAKSASDEIKDAAKEAAVDVAKQGINEAADAAKKAINDKN